VLFGLLEAVVVRNTNNYLVLRESYALSTIDGIDKYLLAGNNIN
jgi:hypothetical protein